MDKDKIKAATDQKVLWKAGRMFYKFCAKCKAMYMYEWKVCQSRYGRTAKLKFAEKSQRVFDQLCVECQKITKEE